MTRRSVLRWAWGGFFVSCIVACGRGGAADDGTGGRGGAALRVVETTPADMATEVPTDASVSAVFDDALAPATVTATSFTLSQREEPLQGAVSLAAEATAAFLPDEPLMLLTEYTATVTTGIESLTGGRLEADYQWVFTTRDGRWGMEGLIQTDTEGPAQTPQLAINSSGQALAVWLQSDSTRSKIWANRYTTTEGWGVAQRIDGNIQNDARGPQVAIDPSGNGLATWQQSDDIRLSVWANRYTSDGGWETAELIETGDAGDANPAGVVVDASGNGLAAWSQSDGMTVNVWANRYTPTEGWGVAQRIDGNNPNRGSGPHLAINPNGSAVAVWGQTDDTRPHIWSNHYTPNGGWGSAGPVEDNDAGPAGGPKVATEPNGDALAVWVQDDGGEFNVIWANRYTFNSGWGAPVRIDANDPSNAGNPQVAVDPAGNALAIWSQVDSPSPVWSNRYTPAEGWGTAETIPIDVVSLPKSPQLDIDPNGNALALWAQDGGAGVDAIWWARYTPAGGWGIAERLRTDNAGRALSPSVGIDSSGRALLVWYQDVSPNRNIWSNPFE
jgi:hypothetical protein